MTIDITGPITGGDHGWPFGAATVDLAAHGYVEEEWFFDGTAPRYRPVGPLGSDGKWAVAESRSSPFKTRAMVRRPSDASRFNGTVLVEWNNVSAGSEIFEAGDTPVIFDEGFAYVGVSAQRVGVHGFAANPQGLRAWDPTRYGTLDIEDDALSYGIFGAVARCVGPSRPLRSPDPLGGLKVSRLIGIGGSQSAGRLATYVNAIAPTEDVFDAFVLFTWFGSGASIDDPTVFDPSDSGLRRLLAQPTRIREDLAVPVMVVNSECETLSCVPVRQLDSERFRFWEVAGAAHGPRLHMERILPKMVRDGLAPPGGEPIDVGLLSPVPWAPVLDAALVHVGRWLDDGDPPPSQPLIEIEGDPPRIRRDGDGNALGGIRVPEMAAALSCNVGSLEESGAAGLFGTWSPLPAQTIKDRYPDRSKYLRAFEEAAQAAVRAGVLRPRDATEAIARASATDFG